VKAAGKALTVLARALLVLWCAFSVFALVWVMVTSLKTNREFFKVPWGLFAEAQWV